MCFILHGSAPPPVQWAGERALVKNGFSKCYWRVKVGVHGKLSLAGTQVIATNAEMRRKTRHAMWCLVIMEAVS